MTINSTQKNEGFTLLEVLITMVVLSIGILGISMMQINSIEGNSAAYSRSIANNIGTTIIEELKRLPFDDPNLSSGSNLDAGKPASAGGTPTPSNADHTLDLTTMTNLSSSFSVTGTTVTDSNNKSYTIFWNVLDNNVTTSSGTETTYKTIRLFIYWDTQLSSSHLEFTAVKNNNFVL